MIRPSVAIVLLALLWAGQTHAGRTGYDVQQNTLTIPSMELGGVRYNFPKVRILAVEVLDVGIISQAPSDFPICGSASNAAIPVTPQKLDQIQVGMGLDEVNQIMGCQYQTPVHSVWDSNFCGGGPDCPSESYEVFTWYGDRCGDYCINSISVKIDAVTRRVTEKSGIFR